MNDKAMTVRHHNGGGADGGGAPPVEAHLWVCAGKNVGRRYPIGDVPKVLGRALECEIVVEDERASQRHARLTIEDEAHIIEDLGSTNGTFVNNQRVSRTRLEDCDLIQVGETVFEYLSQDERILGTAPLPPRHGETDVIPDNLRSGAQQMLRRVRRDQVEPVPPGRPARAAVRVPPGAPVPPGGGYPPYGGRYSVHDEEEDEAPGSGGTDLIALLVRVRDIVLLYKPYWPMAVAFAFVGVMLGALHFKLNPPLEEASFQILLRTSGTSAILGEDSERTEFFVDQVGQRFLSPPVVEAALERVNGERPTDGAVDGLLHSLSFYPLAAFQAKQFEGKMAAPSGEAAVRYLNTHLDVWLEREIEMALSQVEADVGFFKTGVDRAARALDAAERALSDYKANNPQALPDLVKSNYTLLQELQQRQSTLQTEDASVRATLRENRRALARTKRLHTSAVSNANPYNVQIAQANSDLATARAAGKGDGHPDVIRLKSKLVELEQLAQDKELNRPQSQQSLNSAYLALVQRIDQDTARLKALTEERREVDQALEEQRAKVKTLPKAEAEFAELARVYDNAQEEYGTLLKKLKNAELLLERERNRAGAQYQIVVPPRVEHKPVGKARIKRIVAGGVGGFGLCLMVITGLLFKSRRLTLSLILGREINFDAFRQPAPAPGGVTALPGRTPRAALPPGAQESEHTDVVRRPPP